MLRVPDLPGRSDLLRAVNILNEALADRDVTARLWVVDQIRVRQYEPDDDDR